MLLEYWKITTSCCILTYLIPTFCAFNAYRVNLKRKADDPKKKDYPPISPWLTPIAFPIMILVSLFVLIVESFLGAAFLIVFPISLILFRESPKTDSTILKWMQKLGNFILKFNTEVLKTIGLYSAVS